MQNRLILLLLLSYILIVITPSGMAEYSDNIGVYYQINIRSFYDSNGDGCGDLPGIIQKLDYINDGFPGEGSDLGVKGINLIDILNGHGPFDDGSAGLYRLNAQYGTLEDLHQLINEVHQRGMKVIINLPLDNISSNPINYKELLAAAKYWLNQGIDGFRLDRLTPFYLPEQTEGNFQWWASFKEEMVSINPDVYLVGKIQAEEEIIATYYNYGFDSCFNLNAAYQIVETLITGCSFDFNETMNNIYNTYEQVVSDKYLDIPFLTNSAQTRIISELEGDLGKATIAAVIMFTLPGNPFIYYGDEIGLRAERQPGELFQKDLTQILSSMETKGKDSLLLLQYYRELIKLRTTYPVLDTGGIIFLDCGPDLIGYIRYYDHKKVFVYHNISQEIKRVRFTRGKDLNIIFDTIKGEFPAPLLEGDNIIFQIPVRGSIVFEQL